MAAAEVAAATAAVVVVTAAVVVVIECLTSVLGYTNKIGVCDLKTPEPFDF